MLENIRIALLIKQNGEDNMKVGLIGLGRMGQILAKKIAGQAELCVFDRGEGRARRLADQLGVSAADRLADIARREAVILALPDQEVLRCIQYFNRLSQPLAVISVATNVSQQALEEAARPPVRCISVKFIAHAGEMALGAEPVIIVNEKPEELAEIAADLFSAVGRVIVGRSDMVSSVNIAAAEAALTAAVQIEENLRLQGITDEFIVKSAIRQVAAGILKAYANNDLGPFARKVVQSLKVKLT